MLTVRTEELLDRLKLGSFEPADIEALGRISAHDFVADLDSAYPCRFQERRLRDKWEIGMARSVRYELVAMSSRGSCFPILILVPIYRNCLFLSCESEAVTGISVTTRLRVRPIRISFQGLALSKGRGFKLDRTPDGWHIKPMGKRTVKLTDEFLQKRGWRFDALQQFAPKP